MGRRLRRTTLPRQAPRRRGGRQRAEEEGTNAATRAPRLAGLAALLGLAATAHPTATAPRVRCPPPAGASPRLREFGALKRLNWIDARLARTGERARIWAWGWGGAIALAGAASLAAVAFVAPADRVDWYAGAITAAVGVVSFLIAPPRVIADSRALRARLGVLPDAAPAAEVCSVLADAEARLVRDAADQRLQQSWWLHLGNLAFNTGVLLVLGLGFGHWASGLINGGVGAAVGEAIIFTQPTATIGDLAAYRERVVPGAPGAVAAFFSTGPRFDCEF